MSWPLALGLGWVCVQLLSPVWLFATPWTVAPRLLCPWDFPGKNTGVGCHFLLQGMFPAQGLYLHLLHWQADSFFSSFLAGGFFTSELPGKPSSGPYTTHIISSRWSHFYSIRKKRNSLVGHMPISFAEDSPSMIINISPFNSQKCPILDNNPYGHPQSGAQHSDHLQSKWYLWSLRVWVLGSNCLDQVLASPLECPNKLGFLTMSAETDCLV